MQPKIPNQIFEIYRKTFGDDVHVQVHQISGMWSTILEVESATRNTSVSFESELHGKPRRSINHELKVQCFISSIVGMTNPTRAVRQTDLVLEAIPENFEQKQDLFKLIDKSAPEDTIFATTTNSLPIGAFADKSTRVQRFVGLHFFYPVPDTKLVEIIKVSITGKDTLDAVNAWCKSIGKIPVICNDSAGFIVNRLLLSYIAEAVRMMERADATAQDIDTAMKLATGSPIGPIQLADYMGHDVILKLMETWKSREPENRLFVPCASQKHLVQRGMLGVKSGEGYYKYNDLKYWVTTFSHRFKNKKDWLKQYQIWKRAREKQRVNS